MSRVDEGRHFEGRHFATAAEQMRPNKLKYAVNFPCQVEVANRVINIDNDDTLKPFMNTTVLDDDRQKGCEYSASVKIDSSFVPDSLALDSFKSEDSDTSVLNQSGSDKRMHVNSGSTHMKRPLQTSEHQNQLQHTSRQLAEGATVPQPEQTSELRTVTTLASSCLQHANNIVSTCILFMMVTFYFHDSPFSQSASLWQNQHTA